MNPRTVPEVEYYTRYGKTWYPGCIGFLADKTSRVFLFAGGGDEYAVSCSVADEHRFAAPHVYATAAIIDHKHNLVWEGTPETYHTRPAVQPGQKIVGRLLLGKGV